jgi:hypothetical protein
MGLSYYYAFTAPAETTSANLKAFLHHVESSAQALGFHPTMVLDAGFDTLERLAFARRLTTGLLLEDIRLRHARINDAAVWEHDAHSGTCHVLPSKGVFLAVTDESGCETLFGFFQFPNVVKDSDGKIVAESPLAGRWHFEQFVDSPNPRYRKIVCLFAGAGYLASERDEYCPVASSP